MAAKVEAAEASLEQATVGLGVVDRVILRLDVGGPMEVCLGLVIYVADPVEVAVVVSLGTADDRMPRTCPPTWTPWWQYVQNGAKFWTRRKFGKRRDCVAVFRVVVAGRYLVCRFN